MKKQQGFNHGAIQLDIRITDFASFLKKAPEIFKKTLKWAALECTKGSQFC